MKISNEESVRATRVAPVAPARPQSGEAGRAAAPGAGPAAQVEISAQARSLSAAKAGNRVEAAPYLPAVQSAPETRDGLVASLKAQMDAGTYHVSGADIADQIVRRAQADNIR